MGYFTLNWVLKGVGFLYFFNTFYFVGVNPFLDKSLKLWKTDMYFLPLSQRKVLVL